MIIPIASEALEQLKCSHLAGGDGTWFRPLKKSWTASYKFMHTLPIGPGRATLKGGPLREVLVRECFPAAL